MADPFEAASGAIKNANEWALSAYKINNERAQADSYAEQVRAQKQAIDMKIGEEIMNDMKDIVATPGSKFKKAKIMAFDMKLQKMGMSLHPVNKAMLEDPETSNQLSQSFSKFTGGDFTPEEAADISNAVGNGKFFDIMNQRAEIMNRKAAAEKMAGSEGMKDIRDLLSGPEGSGMPLTRRIWDASSGDPMRFNAILARSPEAQREIQIANKNRSNRASQTYQTEQTQKATTVENTIRGFAEDTLKKYQEYETAANLPESKKVADDLARDPSNKVLLARLQELNSRSQSMNEKRKLKEAESKTAFEINKEASNRYSEIRKRYDARIGAANVILDLEGSRGVLVDAARRAAAQSAIEGITSVMREYDQKVYGAAPTIAGERLINWFRQNFQENTNLSESQIREGVLLAKRFKNLSQKMMKTDLTPVNELISVAYKKDPAYGPKTLFNEEDMNLLSGKTKIKEPVLTSKRLSEAKEVSPSANPRAEKVAAALRAGIPKEKIIQALEGPKELNRKLTPKEMKELGL